MNTETSHLHEVVDAEIAEVEASADRLDDDEPERAPYETRLRALHEAVLAVEGTRHEPDR